MDMTTTTCRGTRLVQLREDRLDAASAIQFKDRFLSLLCATGSRRGTGALQAQTGPGGAGAETVGIDIAGGDVVLDLAAVDFLDSSGLGAIVAVRKYLPRGANLHLANLRPAVARVMALTRMDRVLPIHDSVEAACAAAQAARAG